MALPNNPYLGTFLDCQLCGVHHKLQWDKELCEQLIFYKICFSCDHWRGCFQIDQNPKWHHRAFVAKGVHYMMEPESNQPHACRGFSGAKFRVRFFDDGSIAESTNVWCQGAISPTWRAQMPDNAEILSEEEQS